MSTRPALTIVVPAYNEERRLPAALAALREFAESHPGGCEVVVADDGSTDSTAGVVTQAQAAWPSLRLVSNEHRGKGAAVRAGMLAASGEQCFLADADLSMPLDQLPAFLEHLAAGAAVVVGSREGDGASRVGEPWSRHLMGRAFNLVARGLGLTDLDDTQCGFKAFNRDAAEALFSRQTLDGFAFDVEILYLAKLLRYRIAVVPVVWHYDGDSRVRPVADSLRMLGEMVRIRTGTSVAAEASERRGWLGAFRSLPH